MTKAQKRWARGPGEDDTRPRVNLGPGPSALPPPERCPPEDGLQGRDSDSPREMCGRSPSNSPCPSPGSDHPAWEGGGEPRPCEQAGSEGSAQRCSQADRPKGAVWAAGRPQQAREGARDRQRCSHREDTQGLGDPDLEGPRRQRSAEAAEHPPSGPVARGVWLRPGQRARQAWVSGGSRRVSPPAAQVRLM